MTNLPGAKLPSCSPPCGRSLEDAGPAEALVSQFTRIRGTTRKMEPEAGSAFQGPRPRLASRLSLGCPSQRGLRLAGTSLGATQRAEEGPWEMHLPGPASLGGGSWGAQERESISPSKHVNPLLTTRKGFQEPTGLGEGRGARGRPLENLDSDGCRLHKGFPHSGLGSLGTGSARGYPSKGPLVGAAQQRVQASTRPHRGPLGFCPGTIQGQGQRQEAGVGSSPCGPSSSPLPHCSLH